MPGLMDPMYWLKTLATGIVISAGATGVLLYACQTKLIYPSDVPAGSRTDVPTPDQFGMPFEDVSLETPDGVKIKAFLMLQRAKPELKPTVLLLHANAGNVGHRLPIAKVFYSNMDCNVCALSYRGYGHSEGSPNEQGLRIDAQTAFDHIVSHAQLEKTKLFLYGQSIGGAVSIDLAARNPNRVDGLIVENTFLSLPKLVPRIMPYLSPFMFLLTQHWPSEASIQTLPPTMPVLFLSGSKDELVPPDHMVDLHKLCSSNAKEWHELPDGDHNSTCMHRGYFERVHQFIQKHAASAVKSEKIAASDSDETPKSPSVRTESSFEILDKEEVESKGAGSTADVGQIAKSKLEEKL